MLDELVGVIDTLNRYEKRKPELEQEMKILDDRTQDLLHHLEYNEFNNYYASKLAFELQDIRRERRKKKNEIELATYKTKERALEVLDEIQNKINLINLGHDFGSPMVDLKNPTYIYEMPKE